MFDLVIRGDRVVTPHGVGAFDIAIQGEKIFAVAESGTFDRETTRRLIDASGKIVMPGGIDPHIHCAMPMPPYPDGTVGLSDGPDVISRAALFGGTTTLIDFANYWSNRGGTIKQTIAERDRIFAGRCYCDYSFHIRVSGDLPYEIFDQLGDAICDGYPTIKLFTTNTLPNRREQLVDFGDIWEIFRVAAQARGLCVIHGEDDDIVMHMYGKLIREGRVGFEHMAEVHNALSEDLSFRRVIRLAENVPGAALYFMHVSAATGIEAVREARARGTTVYGETLHQYLMFTDEDYKRVNGQIYHTYPSLKSKSDQAALWTGFSDGLIHTVATDENCCQLSVKVQGKRIDNAKGGSVGVEPRLAIMYTEMVGRRGYPLQKFVELTSTNAAKIMGLYPRKGTLAPGSDADITVLDPSRKMNVRLEMLHATDYSPWEGQEVYAWPSLTILRGKVKVDDGRFLGDPGDGRYLYRKISEEILGRPML